MKENVLKELLEIKAKVDALICILQSEENSNITASVEEIRKIAVLEEIYRRGGSVTPEEVSEIARKWGKHPSSTAGYYSGKCPSLEASEDANGNTIRKLTSGGENTVEMYRLEWGNDWIDRVPLELVGNANTKTSEIAF